MFQDSWNVMQAETMKRKRKRMVDYFKAGVEVPQSERPIEGPENVNDLSESESELEEDRRFSSQVTISKNTDEVKPMMVHEKALPENATLSFCSSRQSMNDDEPVLDNRDADDGFGKNSNIVVLNR